MSLVWKSSSVKWSWTTFNVDILCIVLLQVRVVRFSGQLGCTMSCLLVTYVSISSAVVKVRGLGGLSPLLPFELPVII